jgi:hypothetical protein
VGFDGFIKYFFYFKRKKWSASNHGYCPTSKHCEAQLLKAQSKSRESKQTIMKAINSLASIPLMVDNSDSHQAHQAMSTEFTSTSTQFPLDSNKFL